MVYHVGDDLQIIERKKRFMVIYQFEAMRQQTTQAIVMWMRNMQFL